VALTVEETQLIQGLAQNLTNTAGDDATNDGYYEGTNRLTHIGIAVPPELRQFETLVNWPRLTVDALEERLDLKWLSLPGQDGADPGLQEGWDANNLDSESSLVHLDSLIYGRGYVCVGTNEEDAEHPLITVESPTEMSVDFDPRKRRVSAALRLYGATAEDIGPKYATLYLPDSTTWLERIQGRWYDVDRDEHRLGVCPVTPFLNRRRTGRFTGVTEMADVKLLTDAAARSLTNLQIAAETHSVPQKWVLGMTKGDFVDSDGNPIPAWQSYFSAIWANQNKDATVGQFSASDLKNFHETVNHYATLVAGLTGLPMRYLGQNTANPPSADGIRADEARLVKRAERKQDQFGDAWGRVFAMYTRIRDGEWVDGNRIKAEWHDAGTPTYGAKTDGIQKLTGGKPILSVEGGWDELGWSEARKSRERGYLAAEASDPTLERISRDLLTSADAADVGD
jgi:hypothetical protein